MIAISLPDRTINDCNLVSKRPNMIAIIENLISRDSSINSHVTLQDEFRHCNHIWPLLKQIAIIYGPYNMVRFGFPIAIIFSPFMTKIAIIFGPHHKNYCNNMWSGPIYGQINLPLLFGTIV